MMTITKMIMKDNDFDVIIKKTKHFKAYSFVSKH